MTCDLLDDQLPARLAQQLSRPLPGRRAHRRMASELTFGRHAGPAPWHARPAAVLACLYRDQGRWTIPLTLRPTHMVDHAGQISFPGGMCEAGESPEQCALREYEEELGAAAGQLTMLGRLTDVYVFASNFLVTPCVAMSDSPPRFEPNPHEVERVVPVPLAGLLDSRLRGNHLMTRRGIMFRTHHFRCGDDLIWGATALVLSELAEVIALSMTPASPGSETADPRRGC